MTVEEALLIVERVLDQGRLNKVQELVFRQAWEGQSYGDIAKSSGYDMGYIKDTGSKLWQMLSKALGEKVTKANVQSVLKRCARQIYATAALSEITATSQIKNPQTYQSCFTTHTATPDKVTANQFQDWGEAIDVSVFFGRVDELNRLEQWIVVERCRLVMLLGMGGMGKTALSVKLAERIQEHFDYVIWRSLRNAPPLKELTAELIQFISRGQETNLPETVDGRISRLMYYLRQHRCLLVLDNAESILRGGERTTLYQEGHEEYGEFLRRLGEERHNSCLVLTSREKPKELAAQEGLTSPVRSLQLTGLPTVEGQKIFQSRWFFLGSESEWGAVIKHYAGNPLALKMVAPVIRDLFDSDVSKFLSLLEQGILVFDDIRNLLDRQFNRLCSLEKEVMYWLAINREPVSFLELQEDLVSKISPSELLEALASLMRRSLIEKATLTPIEKTSNRFTQQPVVMEYMTEQLIKQVVQEIVTQELDLFKSHALLKAQAKDYIRNTQTRLTLKPVAKQLLTAFHNKSCLEKQLNQILSRLQGKPALETGYAAGNTFNLMQQLQIDFIGRDFSKLTLWQADLRRMNLHQVNFQNSDLAKCVFAETFSSILSVALSPNGKLIATGDADCKIRLWQVADSKPLVTCKGHTNWVRSVAFSPDGKIIASGSADHTVRLWDASTGQVLRTLQGHTSRVWSVAFSPDGCRLASGSEDHTVRLWDASTGQVLRTLQGHTSRVWSVAFSPDGQFLSSGSADGTVRLWDFSLSQTHRILQGHTGQIRSVAFSGNGQFLASGSEDQTIKLWDVSNGQLLRTLQGHSNGVRSIAFSPNGYFIASSDDDYVVRLWELNTGQCLKTLQGHTNQVWSVAWSLNGSIIASGSSDQTVRLWDVHTGQVLRTLQGHTNRVRSVAFSPSDRILASGYDDSSIRLWQVSTDQCSKTLLGHTNQVWSVAWSPDGYTLASGSADQTVRLWQVSTGQCLRTLQAHTDWVWSVAFSPDGQLLASSSDDQTVRLWDVSTGQCLRTLQGHTNWVWSVAFSPDGQFLASGSNDQTVKLWDVSTGQALRTLQGHTDGVRSVAFSPDGMLIASSSEDQTIRLWEASTGRCLSILQGHTNWVSSVAFSPDGYSLVSGSADQTIRLWDVSSGQCDKALQGHSDWVRTVAMSSNGQILASGSEDETIKLWDVKRGSELKTLRATRFYEGMNITGVTGLTKVQKETLKALGAVELEDLLIQ
ncbi:MAG: NACHT domain-containing protein [Microcoleus sp. SIO2G3]|nr:NACHT domain-containing protein [Microcoleus sp. SIO2G3]